MLLQLIGGLFLIFTVITPLADLDFSHFFNSQWNYTAQGNRIVTEGELIAQEQLNDIIKQRCEAYILDKAASLGADIRVELALSQDELPVPVSVTIYGAVSPVGKRRLQEVIRDELGIPLEAQKWN